MPAMPISRGIVTYRSVSSALQPSGWVMTSTIGGTGFGYASMSSALYAPKPTHATARTAAKTSHGGPQRAATTMRWIIGG